MVYSTKGALFWCRMSLTERVIVPGEDSIVPTLRFGRCSTTPFSGLEISTFSMKLNLRVPMLIKPPTDVEAYLLALLLPPPHLISE